MGETIPQLRDDSFMASRVNVLMNLALGTSRRCFEEWGMGVSRIQEGEHT